MEEPLSSDTNVDTTTAGETVTEEVQEVALPLRAQCVNVADEGAFHRFTVVKSAPLSANEMAECVRALANASKDFSELRGFTMAFGDDQPILYVPCAPSLEAASKMLQTLQSIFQLDVPNTAWCHVSQVLTNDCRVHLRLIDDKLYSDGTVDRLVAALMGHEDVRSVTLNGETVEALIRGRLVDEADRDRIEHMFTELGVAIEITAPSPWELLFG